MLSWFTDAAGGHAVIDGFLAATEIDAIIFFHTAFCPAALIVKFIRAFIAYIGGRQSDNREQQSKDGR